MVVATALSLFEKGENLKGRLSGPSKGRRLFSQLCFLGASTAPRRGGNALAPSLVEIRCLRIGRVCVHASCFIVECRAEYQLGADLL